ncbi:MAG: lytic murein transglycosylase [Syntrophobacteria bacterium]
MIARRQSWEKQIWVKTSITLIFLVLAVLAPSSLFGVESLFGDLQRRLVADDVNPGLVEAIYGHSLIRLVPEVVAGNLKRSEKELNYEQFLSPSAVGKTRRYLERHRPALQEAEQRFGVPPSVVVAILMVETALGTYTGKYLTINVLSTMAVSEDPLVKERIFSYLSADERQVQSERTLARLRKRAIRSYRELKALFGYLSTTDTDPFRLRGSSEGAIGIPQFLPSNIDRYGRDGDGNNHIDLFDHRDAIASVAFFLKAHHWKEAQSPREKKRVLLHYNRSRYYVDTVYALAERLDQAQAEP